MDFTWSNVLNILHGLRLTDTGTFSFNTHFHVYSWNIWYEHCIASMGINLLRLMKFIISWLPFGHLHYTAQYPSTMYILSFSDFQISPSSWLPKNQSCFLWHFHWREMILKLKELYIWINYMWFYYISEIFLTFRYLWKTS